MSAGFKKPDFKEPDFDWVELLDGVVEENKRRVFNSPVRKKEDIRELHRKAKVRELLSKPVISITEDEDGGQE